MNVITKEQLIENLVKIKKMGWVENARKGNAGGVGNTLEDLLGIKENNLPIPNAAEWELKAQRTNTSSLITFFHMEPSPRALKFVPNILLLNYGWIHKEAGKKYPSNEMSFRQTISGRNYSDRGFKVIVDRSEKKVRISFNSTSVDPLHYEWLNTVISKVGLGDLDPQPYWGFDDLFHKAGTKLINCFFVQAESKFENDVEYFHFTNIMQLEKFSIDNFLNAIEENKILVDFDARTGHNHGTKFRMRQNCLFELYEKKTLID